MVGTQARRTPGGGESSPGGGESVGVRGRTADARPRPSGRPGRQVPALCRGLGGTVGAAEPLIWRRSEGRGDRRGHRAGSPSHVRSSSSVAAAVDSPVCGLDGALERGVEPHGDYTYWDAVRPFLFAWPFLAEERKRDPCHCCCASVECAARTPTRLWQAGLRPAGIQTVTSGILHDHQSQMAHRLAATRVARCECSLGGYYARRASRKDNAPYIMQSRKDTRARILAQGSSASSRRDAAPSCNHPRARLKRLLAQGRGSIMQSSSRDRAATQIATYVTVILSKKWWPHSMSARK